MAFAKNASELIMKLPMVRGRYTPFAPIGESSWFRAGGVAEILYKPADREDLAQFLSACPDDVPITVLGVCSNVIIRDGGIPGVVIRMGRDFSGVEQEEGARLFVGSATLDLNVAMSAQRHGIAGLEFFAGIPGTIGGALRMNAGAYGTETCDVLVEAEALTRDGQVVRLKPDQKDGPDTMVMTYRHNSASPDLIFTGALLQGEYGDAAKIENHITEIKQRRADTQPVRARTGGSTFANPLPSELEEAGLEEGIKTWQLIDRVGGRGFQIGGAQMSEKHCNFMINTGEASAADLENLGEEMRRRVFEETGLRLRWEIRRLGDLRVDLPVNEAFKLDEYSHSAGKA